ncbi:MAG TPA: hypothetical protein VJ550_08120 [Geomonas sp.]|nr:hypothetical protein [Geomonas sp.]
MRIYTTIMLPIVLATLSPFSCWASLGHDCCQPPSPPQQAFVACRGKSAGSAVEMTTPEGKTMKAVCRDLDGQLVAVPELPPPPRHRCDCKCQSEGPAETGSSK